MSSAEERLLRELYRSVPAGRLQRIKEAVVSNADIIAGEFYNSLMDDEVSRPFLDNEIVNTHLKAGMKRWLTELFSSHTDEAVDIFIKQLLHIGERHAKQNIPFDSLLLGSSVLKANVFQQIISTQREDSELVESIMIAEKAIDYSISIMNQLYLRQIIDDARSAQSLRLHALGHDMALQSESLRSSLFDWHRKILRLLLEKSVSSNEVPHIARTDFGLWVKHKGRLLFPDSLELGKLEEVMESLTETFELCLDAYNQNNKDEVGEMMNRLDELIVSATSILSTITEKTLAQEGGRDALTRLYNRRFLRTVMQQETTLSLTTDERFGILLIDVDNFKLINDTYGHEVGDIVLQRFAELVTSLVRAGDVIFRYGGEEFLVVLGGITADQLGLVAEKVRDEVEKTPFVITQEASLDVTVSIGIALHDGHPDYERLISQADDALYRAKANGRNLVVAA